MFYHNTLKFNHSRSQSGTEHKLYNEREHEDQFNKERRSKPN